MVYKIVDEYLNIYNGISVWRVMGRTYSGLAKAAGALFFTVGAIGLNSHVEKYEMYLADYQWRQEVVTDASTKKGKEFARKSVGYVEPVAYLSLVAVGAAGFFYREEEEEKKDKKPFELPESKT